MAHASKLAILGGTPVIGTPFQPYNSIGQEEIDAVSRVLKSGVLSGFFGDWGEEFFGGPVVRAFEAAWSERFEVKHVVSVNSATSGLYAAMGAIGVGPGDEVIVPPLTMSATVMAPLIYGGIPVFADIDPDTFCLDPDAVRRAITPRTKAILAVDLFGHAAQLAELMSIALEFDIKLVEDNAQGPLATENGQYAGTVGHIGVFSLNFHKHIHTGEGGMCVTNDEVLALRLQMIRNHAESVVGSLGLEDLTNLVGFNYRMTEMSAAVGLEQLKKIDLHVGRREHLAKKLTEGISGLEGLTPPLERSGCRHVYYVWAMRFDADIVGVGRQPFAEALGAEGFPYFFCGSPMYLLPIFQNRMAIGSRGFPFSLSSVEYDKGLCPVAERIHEMEFIGFEPCRYDIESEDIELLVEAIHKVYEHREELVES